MEILDTLKERFMANMDRHPEVSWDDVIGKLDKDQAAAVAWMEESGGEPDVIAFPSGLAIVDCAKEAPAGQHQLVAGAFAMTKRPGSSGRSFHPKAAPKNWRRNMACLCWMKQTTASCKLWAILT